MKILVVTWIDAANLSIENIIAKMIEKGHYVDIYAFQTDYKSIRMFEHLSIKIYSVSELNQKQVNNYDIAFTVDSAMRALRFFDIYVFSYNYVPDTWISEGSDFMFTMVNDRKLRYEEDCAMMPIGCAKNDKEISTDKPLKQILFIDAGHNPFGEKAKKQVANMLISICKKMPDYTVIIKPRWLPSEITNQAHRSGLHIYDVLREITENDLPENLVMLEEHRDMQELIDESTSVITTSVSSYFDVALRKKGCIIVSGFDSEEGYDTRPSITNAYKNAEGSGCVIDFKDVIKYLPQGIMCNENHLRERIPYLNGVSDRIVSVMEYVYQKFISIKTYPDIRKYDYETYKNEMTNVQGVSLKRLRENRFKNGALIVTRFQEHVKAAIDRECLYKKICSDYVKYSMDAENYIKFLDDMEYERKMICLKHESIMQNDDIDQAIYFQALYDTGREDEFLSIDSSNILCTGPYHYYLGMIHAKYNQVYIAIEHFVLFLEEALGRFYDKYPQESNWGIQNAFRYIFRNFNENIIEPQKLAYLCIKLSERDVRIIDYNIRIRIYHCLPGLAQKIRKDNPQLAYLCLELYAKKSFVYLIKEEKKRTCEAMCEVEHIKNSISYKFGRIITCPLRWMRKVIRLIRHVRIKKLFSIIKMKCQAQHIVNIWKVFYEKVLRGYNLYCNYIKKYNLGMHLYLSAISRGDAYILGGFFQNFLERKEYPENPVFVVWSKGSVEIANLFHIENIESVDTEEFQSLVNLLMFNHENELNIEMLHFHMFYRHTAILGYTMGLHGFNLLSLSAAALGISENCLVNPNFTYNEYEVEKVFVENKLIVGKTVVLSPYAKTVRSIPLTFWIKLVNKLKNNGFTVCTNVAGEEKELLGTIPIFIPFRQSVPFLEKAGVTIGIRSGFQDVTSTANCLKISIIWENIPTPYCCCSVEEAFCLKDMYHQQDQVDLIYNFEREEELIKEIVETILAYYLKCEIEKGG